MAKQTKVPVHVDEGSALRAMADRTRQSVTERAFELFERNGGSLGELADWLMAERELVWEPSIRIVEVNGAYVVEAAVPGVDMKDLDVHVGPHEVLVQGETRYHRDEVVDRVHRSEFGASRVFRRIDLPAEVDMAATEATLQNGMLRVRAPILDPVEAAADEEDDVAVATV